MSYEYSDVEVTGAQRRGMRWLGSGVVLLVAVPFLLWLVYLECRIEVPRAHQAILIRKTGKDLSNNEEVAPTPDHKGVQIQVLTEGRYFYNPYFYDWEVMPQFEVPNGKLGVKVRLIGEDLPYGQFLATDKKYKGIVAEILNPGRHVYNPYVEKLELHEPVTVPAGFKGVVTNLAGPLPPEPNTLLVPKGYRGVQEETLDPGTYYLNPYVTRVSLVDCRSQRHNLAEEKDMGFASKDGFWVELDGRIEFRVKPQKAAEVFVIYNEVEINGDRIDEELINKVIVPNARSFCRLEGSNSLGRELMQGTTRTAFQEKFETEMREACEPVGIEIVQALITTIEPPQQIADPIRKREIAKQQELQYKQQILQQESEMKLAIEKETVKQKQAEVKAEQEVVVVTTEAERLQDVAVTQANARLAVAQLKLDAAKDEASAIMERGKAAAEVVRFENQAHAAGWAKAVKAFGGDGAQYAQYVLFQKLASAYRTIMVNTADSPIMKIFESFATDSPSGFRNQEPMTSTTAAGGSGSTSGPAASEGVVPPDSK
jgi:regulator of protease activity HflC (stomatin/prohibitin superfamily)